MATAVSRLSLDRNMCHLVADDDTSILRASATFKPFCYVQDWQGGELQDA